MARHLSLAPEAGRARRRAATVGLHLRATVRGLSSTMWLDGLVVVFAVAAVGTHLVMSDFAYLGTFPSDPDTLQGALGWLCLLGISVLAFAAWQRVAPGRIIHMGRRTLALSSAACLVSTGLLVVAGLAEVEPVAVCLAGLSLLTAMCRTALTMRELRQLVETRRQATTDDLTGLPNRRWFDRRLRAAIEGAAATGGSLALLVIDLDQFKELNDTLGHHAGDRVLAQLGARIRPELRTTDDVARLGGDEFAVLLDGAHEAESAGARIAGALGERFTVEGIDLQIAASIGIALYPEHGEDAETLLQRADVAMYQAKARRSGAEFYARERDLHTRERLQLIGELRDAVAEERLTLHFQPKLDLGRNKITGVEALVRWPHPVRGMVPPSEFIPLAEQTGVIRPLTDLVIARALRQAAEWRRKGLHLTMAVNVSATCLLEDGWTEAVLAAIAGHDVRHDRFVVEITEDVLMTDPDRSLEALAKLSAAGVRVALDDFGTGYSSLAYLKKLPVDELKIDRSFVFEMGSNQADAAIVQTAIDLGRRLGIGVVAEGVEDAATLRRLTDYGAGVAQGFHIARPMPAGDLEAWLVEHEDVERARAVNALHAIQLDVGRRARA